MKRLITVFAALLLFGAGGATGADEVYRWVENGQVHYGDRAPKGVEAERITPQQGDFELRDSTDTAGESTTTDADEQARTERIRQEQCEKARTRLERYREASRIRVERADGSTRDMTAEERVEAIARAEADVAELCSEAD